MIVGGARSMRAEENHTTLRRMGEGNQERSPDARPSKKRTLPVSVAGRVGSVVLISSKEILKHSLEGKGKVSNTGTQVGHELFHELKRVLILS